MTKRSEELGVRNLLLIVSRMPTAGETKTRLAATTGDKFAASLHEAFISDLMSKFTAARARADSYRVGWAYSPPEADFGSLLNHIDPDINLDEIYLVPQSGATFTDRLANLADWSNQAGFRNVILMASDSPQLEPEVIVEAFDALKVADLVIGRVLDGGYYLVGLTGNGDVIRKSQTGTSDAAESLANSAREIGMSAWELPPTFDIDVETDLELLYQHLSEFPESAPQTLSILESKGLFEFSSASAEEIPGLEVAQ
jgi:uncharacterized protein